MCAFLNATHPSIQPPAATGRFDRAPYTCPWGDFLPPLVYHMVIHFILDEAFKHLADYRGKTNWTVTSWRGLGALFRNRSNLCGLLSRQKPTLGKYTLRQICSAIKCVQQGGLSVAFQKVRTPESCQYI